MPEYRVTAGTHRTSDGERAEPGDIIELDEQTAAQFTNKLERVESDSESDADDSESALSTDDTVDALSEDAYDEVEAEVESVTAEDQDVGADAASSDAGPSGASDEDVGGVEAAGNVPDDYALLSKMAKHHDGEEIHGAMSGDEITGYLETLSDTEVAALKQQAQDEVRE